MRNEDEEVLLRDNGIQSRGGDNRKSQSDTTTRAGITI